MWHAIGHAASRQSQEGRLLASLRLPAPGWLHNAGWLGSAQPHTEAHAAPTPTTPRVPPPSAPVLKLLWGDILRHGQVVGRGLQVLPKGEDVHPRLLHVHHGVDDLVIRLTCNKGGGEGAGVRPAAALDRASIAEASCSAGCTHLLAAGHKLPAE